MSPATSGSISAATSAWPASGVAGRALEDDEARAHMRDVEQAGVLAGPFVLGDDAGGVLDGQRIAGERHHAAAELYMLVVEDDGLERFVEDLTWTPPGQVAQMPAARATRRAPSVR